MLFGVHEVEHAWGIGEVRGNAVRDLAALNKVEMLPWDEWGRMDASYRGETGADYRKRIENKIVGDRAASSRRDEFLIRVSAEMNSLLRSSAGERDRVVYLVSETGDGRLCGERLVELTRAELGSRARMIVVDGLQVRDAPRFRRVGVRNLFDLIDRLRKETTEDAIELNATGGFKGMVGALGGVEERNLTAVDNPRAGLVLTPAQALAYAHGLLGPGGMSSQARISLQEALGASLIARVRNDLSDPLATYRFLDAFTRSLTIDSQLGGMTGLYHLAQVLHGLPAAKIAYFALPPSHLRTHAMLSDATDAPWTQPADSEIFASFRNDVQVSQATLAAADRLGKSGVLASARRATS